MAAPGRASAEPRRQAPLPAAPLLSKTRGLAQKPPPPPAPSLPPFPLTRPNETRPITGADSPPPPPGTHPPRCLHSAAATLPANSPGQRQRRERQRIAINTAHGTASQKGYCRVY